MVHRYEYDQMFDIILFLIIVELLSSSYLVENDTLGNEFTCKFLVEFQYEYRISNVANKKT